MPRGRAARPRRRRPRSAAQAEAEEQKGGGLLGKVVHGALDVGGLAPVIGEPADLANAGIYALEGDELNAALSAASAIPIAGYGATAVKAGRYADEAIDAGRYADEAGDAYRAGEEGAETAVKRNLDEAAPLPPGRTPNQYWTKRIDFQGSRVHQRDDLIDPGAVDPKGRTNVDRMERGLAPVGPDGKPLNLHHTTQRNDGALAEVAQTFHQQNARTLHINPSSVPSGIDRQAFEALRRDYWKARARDFGPFGRPDGPLESLP